jgi:hypothetical protein
MKKVFIVFSVLALFSTTSRAQFRKMTQGEIDYLNKVRQVLYEATPHEYADWKGVGDEKEFDARTFWCPGGEENCIGTCPVSTGKKDPYGMGYAIDFTIPDDQKGGMMAAAMGDLKDYTNVSQVAKVMKAMAKTTLHIQLYVNDPGTDGFSIVYCPKTPPVRLNIPVPTASALMGIRSAACPATAAGQPDMHANYYDSAIIVLGKPLVRTKHETGADGMATDRFIEAFDKTRMGALVTQNITVALKGDAKDIQAAIALINWQKLYALLDK